jgi:hypothetical protein
MVRPSFLVKHEGITFGRETDDSLTLTGSKFIYGHLIVHYSTPGDAV